MATLPVAFSTQNEEALARAAHLETFLALTATQGKPPASSTAHCTQIPRMAV
jgi:hypothetical protein